MEFPLVWTEIDLNAIAGNVEALRKITSKHSEFMAVVKADGYGHGAVEVANRAIESGADWLGVARLHEALDLRNAGISVPLLIFGMVHPAQASIMAGADLTASLYSLEMAEAFSEQALKKGCRLKAHLKVDTGMGRVGILPDELRISRGRLEEAVSEVEKMASLPGLDIQGIYTHFASADSRDRSYTRYQIEVFKNFVDDLSKAGIEFLFCHAANSAAIIDHPESHLDMVRAGISMYGLYPSHGVNRSKVDLLPAMTWKARITCIKKVKKGFHVSYGMTYTTDKDTVLATVAAGYADGFSRSLSSRGKMLVRGMEAPIVGRVCMDQTLIDVGHVPGVKTGDEAVLIGSQGNKSITADDMASLINTINYEVVSSLTPRVHRFFV